MIVVDTLLAQREAEGNPVKVAIAGPGFMARGAMHHIFNSKPGMDVAVVYARTPEKGVAALEFAGKSGDQVKIVQTAEEIDALAATGGTAVTSNYEAMVNATSVEAVLDATGSVEFGAHLAMATLAAKKHLVLLNAEVDATIGTILNAKFEDAGLVYTGADGDQPGVQMNLIRFVRGLGVTPLVAGNIKGLQDPYRNPSTQEGFARQWGQDPHMVTSFADGTKVSVEQALVANAADLSIHKRGLLQRDHRGHVDDLTGMYDVDELKKLGGAVDYVVGTKPGPGVYVLGTHDDPKQQHYLNLYKLGEGPLYSFYTPYHLCHFEVPDTLARAVLLGDACIKPLRQAPKVEVITIAKKDLKAGETLDALGGYTYYGECERADVTAAEKLLPVGLAHGCVLTRDIAKDEAISYNDVIVPQGRLADELRREQDTTFPQPAVQ
ncbi:NAD(P)H-dependent oxidoreductase [Dermatophilus congolensis]|uniref:Predicted homoserine dehydrogenase n=1 Tax=Dermatophilus congolensis TaxID=1863 RepID=A0A239VBF9_9MICO|nr:NAD(P)-dependent oxidoreductase [Dermatophilus congolensis]MBO3128488.1 NAD(P)-dependent oxidoreductase [Dermatophilus congolensis]MBO3132874.1 NAD(P)-dependent oxidoreductase [Dermatophilus congolensis]MBO3132967.1 NAD(P)-dependent oxidoreductase [Dermatophilus congolensis]MBO3135204.1 NAD(P)-dependent oxidoreductase [Dermatophilus congolensis]MBO3137440.1 NAD(P)-dependent oxidoreductase [Dermatophilus congolensis]